MANLKPNKSKISFLITFVILFVIWIILSGKFDLFHISLGLISCFLVSYFSWDHLLPDLDVRTLPGVWIRFIRYIPWLLYQILVANIHLLYLVFHPRTQEVIDPRIMRFNTRLKDGMALVTLANSITLTPGTITIYISVFGEVTFHVIDIQSGKTLPFIMEAKVAEIFKE